jgi:hypothetical protein
MSIVESRVTGHTVVPSDMLHSSGSPLSCLCNRRRVGSIMFAVFRIPISSGGLLKRAAKESSEDDISAWRHIHRTGFGTLCNLPALTTAKTVPNETAGALHAR